MKDMWKPALYIIIVCIFGFLFRGTYVMLYPYNPITVHSIKILDQDNVVVAGEKIYYSIHVTKHMPLVATVRRRLVNSYVLPLPDIYGSNPVGEHTIKAEAPIPEFADSGNYKLMIDYEYTVSQHPERKVVVSVESPQFRVVQKPSLFAESNAKEIRYLKKKIDKEEAIMKEHRKRSTYDKAK